MRSYCSVYVDAGYLLASAATRVTGTSLRGGVTIHYRDLIDAVIHQAEEHSGLPLLRVNWYDSAAGSGRAPDATQDLIGMLPRTKLRLGRMSPGGEQKGVDLRIGLDLVTHARNHVADIIYLVSGDDDLTEAVEEAQGHGVQVIILAAPSQLGLAHAVSRNLQREADDLIVIDPVTVDLHVKERRISPHGAPAAGSEVSAPRPDAPNPSILAGKAPGLHRGTVGASTGPRPDAPAAPESELAYSTTTGRPSVDRTRISDEALELVREVARGVVATWRASATENEVAELLAEAPYIPRDLDRALLTDLSSRLGIYDIEEDQRYALRQSFWDIMNPPSPEAPEATVTAPVSDSA